MKQNKDYTRVDLPHMLLTENLIRFSHKQGHTTTLKRVFNGINQWKIDSGEVSVLKELVEAYNLK